MSKKNKKPVKKVTAPVTYDPGKGRPKEYLAYLNWQEMEALKRLNGNNMEWGPKGLPSFPPSGTTGKSSSTGARGPTGPQGQPRSSPAGNKGGAPGSVSRTPTSTGARGPTGPAGQPRTSPAGGRPGAVSRPSGSGFAGIGGGGARDSGQAAARAATATPTRFAEPSRGSAASTARISGGVPGGNQRDAQVRQAAASRSISKAAATPALRDDRSKTVNVGPMGTPVALKDQPGAKIRGAIKGVQQAAAEVKPPVSVKPPAQTMQQLYSQYQQPPSVPPTKAQIAQRLREAYPDRWGKYSLAEVENAVETMAQSLPGEADINKYSAASMRNLAQVGINQVLRNLSPERMLKNIDTTGLDVERGTQGLAYPGPRSMGMTGNWADQNLARQSYETALRSIESAIENKGVAPQARYATNFVAAGTPMVEGVRPVGSPVYGTQFGVDPAGRAAVEKRNRVADIKRDYAQYRSPPGDVRIVPAAATPERSVVPGLIQYPGLDRPMAPTAGRSAVVPTSRKTITDRITPDYSRISADPTIAGKDLTPRGKQIYDRILSESGDLPISIGGDIKQSIGAGAVGAGNIAIPPREIGVSGVIGGSSGYSQDVIKDVYGGSVIQPKFRSATQIAADFPSPIRPLGGVSGIAGIGATPEQVSLPVSGATATVAGAPGLGVEASREVRLSGVGVDGGIAGLPGVSSDVSGSIAAINEQRIPGLKRVSNIFAAGSPRDLAKNLREQITKGYETVRPETVAESVSPSQESAAPSQDITLSPEAEQAQEETRKKAKTTRRGAQTLLNIALGPGVGTVAGQGLKYLDGQVQKLVDAYQSAGMEERKAMEEKYPNLIPRAQAMGINSYYGMDKYRAWAEGSGLRAPPTRESGGRESSGIASLVSDATGGEEPSAPEAPSTSSGRRPDIYYMWDLGVNIPSPGDPNYTQYQTYLAERLAAQRAMGYA